MGESGRDWRGWQMVGEREEEYGRIRKEMEVFWERERKGWRGSERKKLLY